MDTAHGLACHHQVVDGLGGAVRIDLQSAVLIVQGRVDQDRHLSNIDVIV